MPAQKDNGAYLLDMLDSARAVIEMIDGVTFDEYVVDRRTRRAIEREIEIIGEAARAVSAAFEQAHPEIPWQKIVAQRHILAHEYGEIKDERIYRVARHRIPELIRLLEPLIH